MQAVQPINKVIRSGLLRAHEVLLRKGCWQNRKEKHQGLSSWSRDGHKAALTREVWLQKATTEEWNQTAHTIKSQRSPKDRLTTSLGEIDQVLDFHVNDPLCCTTNILKAGPHLKEYIDPTGEETKCWSFVCTLGIFLARHSITGSCSGCCSGSLRFALRVHHTHSSRCPECCLALAHSWVPS